MFQGFKEFIMRGNVVELAVAVVIGGAFTAIVGVVVDALVNPLIALFFNADSLNEALQVQVPTIMGDGTSTFMFGAVIGAIINFLVVAAVVYFALVMPMNKMAERRAARYPVEEAPAGPTQEELLAEIRDLLAAKRV